MRVECLHEGAPRHFGLARRPLHGGLDLREQPLLVDRYGAPVAKNMPTGDQHVADHARPRALDQGSDDLSIRIMIGA